MTNDEMKFESSLSKNIFSSLVIGHWSFVIANPLARIFHYHAPSLINTTALARWKLAKRMSSRFQRLLAFVTNCWNSSYAFEPIFTWLKPRC